MLTNMLDLTCDVEQVTTASTAFGGQAKTYSSRLSSVPCSLKTFTKANPEIDAYGKRTVFTNYRFYLEATTANLAITESDRVIYDGEYYEVNIVYDVAGKGQLLQIDCMKVE